MNAMVGKTILYTKRIHGCHECPSCYVDSYDKRKDKCLRVSRRNGTFVHAHRWPRWCPCIANAGIKRPMKPQKEE